MGKQAARYVIDENQLKTICETAAAAGVDAYLKEHEKAEKERQNRVLNSAKTLVVNYRRFKKMCERSVYDRETTNEPGLQEILELMNGKFRSHDFEVMSIKDKVVRTKMIMDHVDTMLQVYKVQCENSPEPEDARRYRVIYAMYLADEPTTAADIAEQEDIDISTVYRDCKNAYRKLALLFFGIDGVRI